MLSGSAAQLRAKLQTKTRYLSTAAVAKILPAGAASLEHVPTLQQFNASDSRLATEEYVQAIRKVARVFGRFHHSIITRKRRSLSTTHTWCGLSHTYV